jgi:hypothetical protein
MKRASFDVTVTIVIEGDADDEERLETAIEQLFDAEIDRQRRNPAITLAGIRIHDLTDVDARFYETEEGT